MKDKLLISKGSIYLVDLGDTQGSEIKKVRPCIVIQNDIGNRYAPTTIVLPITHRTFRGQPTQVLLSNDMILETNLPLGGVIMTEQIRTVDKKRLTKKIGSLSDNGISLVEKAVLASMGIMVAV